ncbi:MAG: prolyl oligopeptidase family serine peptidase [Saprospiraceae bacterium]|nr:prolyl oligopeptidase family serine peptidase [Saprospiraceae bacterium]
MKRICSILFLCFCLSFVHAQKKSGQPPLIDREIFFGDPEISGAQLSPNGKFMSFIKPFNGTRNIWVKKANQAFDAAVPITADTKRPIGNYFWSRDSKYILYVQDKGGNENYHVYAVNPIEKAAEGSEVPPARNLTDLKNVRSYIYAVPKTNTDLMYVGLNDRDPAWHDLYEIKISTGERKMLRQNTDRMVAWIFDRRDKLRLAMRSNPDGSTDLLKVEPTGLTKIYSCGVLENFSPVNFHENGQQIYMETNVGSDLSRLVLFNINTKAETLVESDPEKKVDFGRAMFSDVTNKLVATFYEGDKQRIYWKDERFEEEYKMLQKQFKGMEIGFDNSTKDENTWLISVYSDTDPGSKYLYERMSKKTTFLYRPRPKMPIDDLAPMTSIRYKSSDGLEIQAYLTLPKGLPQKNLPLLVIPHGGPWARDQWGYNSYAQLWSNRGYAVLQPNFRASTGFGKKFIDAGNKQWGDKMQDDITWGVQHLVKKGMVDAKRVGILGGSYGGYATLAGLTFTPDVYACGVSIVGPSSLLTLLESIPPYWEAGRKIFHERMGDPTNEMGAAQLKRQSPLYSVDKIKVPLMVVQGANDPRVKKAESDQIVIAMRDKNLPVEYILAPDEGHGFARPVNHMAYIASAEKFLAKHLGGRAQEDMTDEVAKRLKEITVDIATVQLIQQEDLSQVQKATPARELKEGTFSYDVKLEAMGKTMEFREVVDITDDSISWRLSSAMETPMGKVYDEGVFSKSKLSAIKRELSQGSMEMKINYSPTGVEGQMTMNGTNTPIKIATMDECFADGPAQFVLIASLPLAPDYKSMIINTDLQKMKEKLMVVEVIGSEIVKGKDCHLVQIKPANGDGGEIKYWISKSANPMTIKYRMVNPDMGGAIITGILQD